MGRPHKSSEERRLDGNPGKRSLPIEAFVPEGAPFVPDHLHEDAQACAEHIIRTFRAAKRLFAPDSYVLSVFATAWAWHKAAAHAMNAPDFEPVVQGSKGPIPNPWFRILDAQARVMLAYAPKLYLTPADRASLVGVGAEKPKSKFDGLTGQTGSSPSFNA